MRKLLNWIQLLINKDVKNENETKQYAVVLRVLALLMCSYFLILIITFGLIGNTFQLIVNCVFLLAYILALNATYKINTKMALWIINSAIIAWVIFTSVFTRQDTGVREFLLVSLVLYMFSSNRKHLLKIAYAVLLLGMQIILHYANFGTLFMVESKKVADLFVFINFTYIFLELFIITFRFSLTSKEFEEKLIVYNENLKKLAATDGLTGLMNRRSFLGYLEEKECYGKNERKISAIALGDIDYFKKINDTYGHECGDLVLKQLSKLMDEFMVDKGLIVRWGGEEFLLLFEGYNGDEAFTQLFQLQKQIRKMQVLYKEQTIKVTMTFGLEEYVYYEHSEVIKKADSKLYMGKNSGRDRIVY